MRHLRKYIQGQVSSLALASRLEVLKETTMFLLKPGENHLKLSEPNISNSSNPGIKWTFLLFLHATRRTLHQE